MENTDSSYESRLNQIRQMPQSLPKEVTNKKESARDLRIESYLAWADLAQTLSSVINVHPETGPDVLMKTVRREKDKLPHPELANKFLFELGAKKSVTQDSLRRLRRSLGMKVRRGKFENPLDWGKDESKRVGVKVFQLITGEFPESDVSILDTSLAVGVLVKSDEDLKKLRQKEINIGGFFRSYQEVTLNKKKVSFPLIVVKQSDFRGRAICHEQGHAVDKTIINVLESARDEVGNRWGGKGRVDIEGVMIKNPEELVDFMQQQILPYALSQAKDEILADYLSNHNFEYVNILADKEGIYNYFRDVISSLQEKGLLSLDVAVIKEVENVFWERYIEILKKNIQTCQNVIDLYNEYGLYLRSTIFPYVLAQIPLSQWEDRVGQDFLKEIKNFQESELELKKERVRTSFRLSGRFGQLPHERENVIKAAFKGLWEYGDIRNRDIMNFVWQNQLTSLYIASRMLRGLINQLDKEHEEILSLEQQ